MGLAVLVIDRSAALTAASWASVSLDSSESSAIDVTVAALLTVPPALGAVTVTVNATFATFAAFASDAAVQVTVPEFSLQPGPTDTNVTFLGSTSVTLTLLAVSGPALDTVRV